MLIELKTKTFSKMVSVIFGAHLVPDDVTIEIWQQTFWLRMSAVTRSDPDIIYSLWFGSDNRDESMKSLPSLN